MTKETTNQKVQELYPESDAATKRDLEGLANAIGRFHSAVSHIAEKEAAMPIQAQMDQAQRRRRSAQRRVMLEWAFAAVACTSIALPGVGYYRHREAVIREQQAQALKQREADARLLDEVADEVSVAVPDAMLPLTNVDSVYGNDASSKQREKNNGRN